VEGPAARLRPRFETHAQRRNLLPLHPAKIRPSGSADQ